MKPRIYIAGPITKGNQFHNVANGIRAASEVFRLGAIPFCPHLTALWDFVDQSMTYEDWMEICFAWIPQCHAVLRIEGESKGADREVELARILGLPVFYSISESEAALPSLIKPPKFHVDVGLGGEVVGVALLHGEGRLGQ